MGDFGKKTKDFDLIIIGSGPAGLEAAIYAARAGLKTVILEKETAGGLVKENPLVENYLGFKSIEGEKLAKLFREHAEEYAEIYELETVKEISKDGENFEIKTERNTYRSKAIIFATGTTHRILGIPGEKEFFGKGVSYCVTCDGYLFKDKRVVVIGGGNSGAIAAISLKDVAKEVKIVEYMPRWMCEEAYRKKIESLSIPYLINHEPLEILGDKTITGVRIKNRETGEEQLLETDGIFIYVGLIPQSDLAKMIGVELDKKGYIVTDKNQRTNIPKVYAAGDITGSQAQIAVAVGQGAIAALSAYEDLRLK